MFKNAIDLNDFVKVKLSVGKWGGKKVMLGEYFGVSNEQMPKEIMRVVVNLVNSKFYNKFNTLYQKSRHIISRWGFDFDGDYYVPKTVISSLEKQLEDCKADYLFAVEGLEIALPKEREALKNKYINIWDKIEPLYPSDKVIMSRFVFDWKIRGAIVSAPEGITKTAERFNELQEDLTDFFTQLGMAIRVEAKKVFDNIKNKLEGGEVFNRVTLDNLIKMCDKITLVDVLEQKELRRQSQTLKKLLGNVDIYELKPTAPDFDEDLKNTAVKELKKMDAVISNMNDLKKAVTSYKRKIIFRK